MIKKLKPDATEYPKSEGNGFSIRVIPTGFKSWLYLYVFDGKRRCMHLGHYPEVSLESARDKFETARKMVKNDVDPMTVAEQAQEERRKAPTVEAWEKMLTSIITVDNGKVVSETAEDSGNNLLV